METNTERNQEIARTICEQLGGMHRLKVMVGARDFVAIANGLAFRIPGKNFARDSINLIRVTLTPSDDYTVEFMRVRGARAKVVSAVRGVYCDQLVSLFEDTTGLTLRMPAIFVGSGQW